jgi:SAM-dependent methyltransferase
MRITFFRAGDMVLDLGSGSGFYASMFSQLGAKLVVAVDSAPSMIAALPSGIRGVVADAGSLELRERFDIVICAGLLEFVACPQSVFRAAHRHLKDGGEFTILFPLPGFFGALYRRYHRNNGIDIGLFSLDDLRKIAMAEGFKIDDAHTVWSFTGMARLTRA